MIYIKVSIPILLFKTFIYSYDKSKKKLFEGQGVLVEFNNRKVDGFIIDISDKTDYKSKINPILSLNKNSIEISKELIKTINWISRYYISPIGKTLKATIPYQLYKNKLNKVKHVKITSLGRSKIKEIKFKKQVAILEYLNKKSDFIIISHLKDVSQSYISICKSLEKKKYVIFEEKEISFQNLKVNQLKNKKIKLNKEQNNIYKNIINQINSNDKKFIVSGVPGCGKTEVYIKVIEKIIKENKQAIVLVPEISLINQTYIRLNKNFKDCTAVWHSKLSHREKIITLNGIKKNNVKIIVGVRSALFVPFNNLGIIVVDEEQENSYKQTGQAPFYNARDVAIIRSKFSNCSLILCSATLSLESFYNIKNNNFHYYYIKNRFHESNSPVIQLINMETEIYNNKNTIFSNFLIERIRETLDNNEQIIILQNRRSYSYIVKCSNCNKTSNCPNCHVSLKYHKNKNLLKCHHCDYQNSYNKICTVCKKKSIKLYGIGTQKIEEILHKLFQSATILRYDKDSTSNKNSHLDILNQFDNHEADILIGTQMIAKGLDFKNVSLVAIINADLGMMFPDFRSGEKTFQLLYQFIGRAGRHKKNSKAIIQSYNVNDPYIKFACKNQLDDYYKYALDERKDLNYPPYSRLIKITITGKNKKNISAKIKSVYEKLTIFKNLVILGPAECPIEKINNLYRYHLIIKSSKNDWINFYKFIIMHIGLREFEMKSNNYQLSIDVDPISFL